MAKGSGGGFFRMDGPFIGKHDNQFRKDEAR